MRTIEFDVDYPKRRAVKLALQEELGPKAKVKVTRMDFGRPPRVTIKIADYLSLDEEVFMREMNLRYGVRLATAYDASSPPSS